MKKNRSPRFMAKNSAGLFFAFSIILCSSITAAQSLVDFSGTWLQDTVQSDDFYKKFNVKYTITQTPEVFTVKQTFSDYGGNEIVTRDYAFTLDGKETNLEKDGGTEKELAQWSENKKILTTRSTRAYGGQEVGNTAAYSLSDDGLVLTVQNSDIIPGGLSVKQVFNKLQ